MRECVAWLIRHQTHCERKPSRQVPSVKTMSLCALCSSAAAAVAIGQLQLQLSHYSLVAVQAFCFPKCDFWGGLEGASIKKFSRLAIARHIFRPPQKLCCNSTTGHHFLSPAILIFVSSAVSVLTLILKQPVPSLPPLSTLNFRTAFTDLPKSQINRLQQIQNCLARTVVKTPKSSHSTISALAEDQWTHWI